MLGLVKGIILSLALLSISYGVWWCMQPHHFPIHEVICHGQLQYLKSNEVRNVILPEVQTGFFRLKVSTLQNKLLSFPWVEQAAVRRIWPDKVEIHLKEHVPGAKWGQENLLSERGVLYHPHPILHDFASLPVLRGPASKYGVVWRQYLAMQQLLEGAELRIQEVTLEPRGAWQVKLSNNIVVFLGTNDILTRLKFFVHAYQKSLYLRQKEIAYVDLRYTKGMSVGWLVV